MTRKPGSSAPERAAPVRRAKASRALSSEEQALWDAVTKNVRRGRNPAKIAPTASTETPPLKKAPQKRENDREEAPRKPVNRAKSASGAPAHTTRSGNPIDPLGRNTPGLDRRTSKKLSRGEHPPEARLDLHGMTAERAHAALIGFIRSQYASGSRCVLVITGKGGRGDGALEGWRSEPVGVLKTMTPEWLRQPPISMLVTGVYQAHRRHGGEGALYVYLRKNR